MQFLDILKKEGATQLLKKGVGQAQHQLYSRIRSTYPLAIQDTEVNFTAANPWVVSKNKERFNSEKQVLLDVFSEINEGDVFYDIGANTGLYSLFVAKKSPTHNVVSFEPYPPNLDVFQNDIDRNNLNNIRIFDFALSDTNGSISFDVPAQQQAGYGSASINPEKEGSSTVSTSTTDNVIREYDLPSPNIVKIDVEGSEDLVIRGMEETLSSTDCRLIYCEVHVSGNEWRPSISEFGSDIKKIKTTLENHGFTVEEMGSRDSEVFLKCEK